MSENVFETLADCLVKSCKILFKHSKNALGLNTHDFDKLFKEIDICNKSKEFPKLDNTSSSEYIKTYTFKTPVGIKLNAFKEHSEEISCFLNVDESDLRFSRDKNKIYIKVILKKPTCVYDPIEHKRNDFKIPIGYSLETTKLVLWDFTASTNAHCYIAGSSGGGKSVMLRVILSHLVNSKSKRDVEFSIINTKRVDLKDFKNAKHTVNYMTGIDGVEDFLENEVDEMERRYKILEKYDCDDLTEFREKEYKIPYRLIVVEEISSYKGNKAYQRFIEILASQGRGAGMLLLLITQLPSHEIMPNTIKCNINTTLGLKTKDSIRSEIIAGSDSGLENLKGNGHAKIFDGYNAGEEIQGLFISKETMKDIIAANSKQNKRTAVAGTTTVLDDNEFPGTEILSSKL